ncbi:hypothetical protein V1264_006080 [Littorina saxatilis]|uniref:Uncharacterized protein n=1 Tax=Littorina saxatilis TaxID=31220 RepID=A0AAN9AWW6_9CAEN
MSRRAANCYAFSVACFVLREVLYADFHRFILREFSLYRSHTVTHISLFSVISVQHFYSKHKFTHDIRHTYPPDKVSQHKQQHLYNTRRFSVRLLSLNPVTAFQI